MSVRRLFQAEPWRLAASCRNHPELDWFPNSYQDIDTQIAICQTCPVRDDCGRAGKREPEGIWGGRLHTKNTMHLVADDG